MSFGTELRQERERRGIDLPAIAAGTKFSERYLRALETDHYGDLPGGIFKRGMVRSYCRHLGLDENEWLTRFSTTCEPEVSEPDWAAFAENVKQGRPPRASTGMRWWGVALMMAVVVTLAWASWHFLLKRKLGGLYNEDPAVVRHAEPEPAKPRG